MDFIEALPRSKGKNAIFVIVDRLTKFSHFIAMSHPMTAKSVALEFLNNVFKLHGMPHKITSDRGSIFVSSFWKELFALLSVDLQFSTAYHPQTDGQSEVVNRCLQSYLRCVMGDLPHSWIQWLPLAQYWYNTSFHSSLQMTPFEALYGIPPPIHVPYFPNDTNVAAVDIFLRDRETAIQVLKANLSRAATRMKNQADKHRVDRVFSICDWVWLKLQPYRQTSICHHHQKFEPKYFGPFQVRDRIGLVAYKLALPSSAQIHDVFHVSQLKPASAPQGPIHDLPPISPIGDSYPLVVIDRRMCLRHNKAAAQWLVHWTNRSPADATWEFADEIIACFPTFLADKES